MANVCSIQAGRQHHEAISRSSFVSPLLGSETNLADLRLSASSTNDSNRFSDMAGPPSLPDGRLSRHDIPSHNPPLPRKATDVQLAKSSVRYVRQATDQEEIARSHSTVRLNKIDYLRCCRQPFRIVHDSMQPTVSNKSTTFRCCQSSIQLEKSAV